MAGPWGFCGAAAVAAPHHSYHSSSWVQGLHITAIPAAATAGTGQTTPHHQQLRTESSWHVMLTPSFLHHRVKSQSWPLTPSRILPGA